LTHVEADLNERDEAQDDIEDKYEETFGDKSDDVVDLRHRITFLEEENNLKREMLNQ